MVLYYCYLVVKKASVLIAMISYHAKKKMVETQITFTVVKHTVNQCNNLFIILLL